MDCLWVMDYENGILIRDFILIFLYNKEIIIIINLIVILKVNIEKFYKNTYLRYQKYKLSTFYKYIYTYDYHNQEKK